MNEQKECADSLLLMIPLAVWLSSETKGNFNDDLAQKVIQIINPDLVVVDAV